MSDPALNGTAAPRPPHVTRKRSEMAPADPLEGLVHLQRCALTGAAILETREEPVAWVWEGRVADDNHVEIAGPSYSGKTTLAMMIAVAAANPGTTPVQVLGANVRPNPRGTFSVVVEEENARRSAADVLTACCGMLGLPIAATLARVLLIARAGVVAHPLNRETLGQSVWSDILALGQRGKVGALFLDSRARVLSGGDSNEERDQAHAQRIIQQAIAYCDAPVFVVSHTRKTTNDSLTLEDLSGSHQRAAGADVVLLVSAERSSGKIQRSRVTFAKIRDSIDEHPEPRTFAIAKAGGKWTLGCGAADGKAPHERVFTYLASAGTMTTSRQIREGVGLSGDDVNEAIRVLLAERRITKGTTMVGGRKRVAFKALADVLDPLFACMNGGTS